MYLSKNHPSPTTSSTVSWLKAHCKTRVPCPWWPRRSPAAGPRSRRERSGATRQSTHHRSSPFSHRNPKAPTAECTPGDEEERSGGAGARRFRKRTPLVLQIALGRRADFALICADLPPATLLLCGRCCGEGWGWEDRRRRWRQP